jgi:hypothetical protein
LVLEEKRVVIFLHRTIGFPDTQQLAEINDRAAQMHAQKRKYMEEEAR